MTKEQVNRKYKGKYVEIIATYDYSRRAFIYCVLNSYESIRENTTLGEDVGTALEYTR